MSFEEIIVSWVLLSLVTGAGLGWLLGRYGHGRCVPHEKISDDLRHVLALELMRVNKLRIKK